MTDPCGHIIAVDGGGSTCRVAIATPEGRVLAAETGPSANPSTSLDAATASIRATIEAAWNQAGFPPSALAQATAYLGLAGVKSPQIANAVAGALPIKKTMVAEDRATTMAGALGARDGYVAAIGTGSFLGRQAGTRQRFVGGWGLVLGDQASGAWLGRQLLAHVLEWQDGLREGSALTTRTLATFEDDPSAIIAFAAGASPQDFARRAPHVLEAADSGDPAAVEILRDGAAYLQQGLNSLGFRDGDTLCLMGGIGARYAPWLDPVFTRNIVQPQGTALDGAIRLGMAMNGRRQDRQ